MKIFVADDEPVCCMLIVETLASEEREIQAFEDGQGVLDAMAENPEIVLIDMDMPNMSGIEVCRQWRENYSNDTHFIFISGHDDLETRIRAYDAGADDYWIKPVNPDELKRKVKAIEAHISRMYELQSQVDMTGKMAFSAMNSLGEMGVIQQFMREVFVTNDIEELVRAVCSALQQYDLDALFEIRSICCKNKQRVRFSSSSMQLSPLEDMLLSHAVNIQDNFQLGNRVIFNYPAATLLVMDFRTDDPEKIGRMKDNIAVLAESVSVRVRALEEEMSKVTQKSEIVGFLAEFMRSLEQVQAKQSENAELAKEINEELQRELVYAFVALGLSDCQEQELIDIAEKAQSRLESVRDLDKAENQQLLALVTNGLNAMLASGCNRCPGPKSR